MTKTTLIILIFCIDVPIIIVSVILILKGLKESNPSLPLLAVIISFCFLVFFLYSIKTEKIAAEKAEQMYYEEMFPQPKMNLIGKKPFTIIPAYDERFILMHPELKEYFLCKVPAERIFSTKLNIDFADGTWQLSVKRHTDEIVRAQFSKDGKYVLVSGIKEGNAVIDISREGEVYGGSILVRVEEPEEWYEKLQEEMKLYSRENRQFPQKKQRE